MFERNVEPAHDVNYANRTGFDPAFLGTTVPLPEVIDPAAVAAPLLGTGTGAVPAEYELKYEHFSIVMHRVRRLALFTAANVDLSPAARRPDPTLDDHAYTRDGLGGLDPNDTERWFLDPRLAPEHQTPDVFFTRDRGAFDRGHLVRRDAVTWGRDYEQVRRANGDSFHVTNCSPQVGHFNQARRSERDGLWGDLEREVARRGAGDRLCVLSGPLFTGGDRDFHGHGGLTLPIPSVFWKVVVSRDAAGGTGPAGGTLRAHAFWLPQDLTGVHFGPAREFAPGPEWERFRIPLAELERKIGPLRFPPALHDADRHGR